MELVNLIRLQWDRALALALAVVAGVMLFVGWFRVSDGIVVTQQIPYVVSAGLGGIFLLGLAATLWLSADFRDEWRALDELARLSAHDVQDDTLVDLEAQLEVAALRERIEQLEARLAALETKPARSRSRKPVATNGGTPATPAAK